MAFLSPPRKRPLWRLDPPVFFGYTPPMLNALRFISANRALLATTVALSLRSRFIGNALGALWLLLYPLLFLSLYTVVFIHILGVRMPGLSTPDYVLVIFSGLVPFLAFSEAFGVGTGSVVSNRGLLRNTLFPIEMVVVRDVVVGHTTMGLGMLLVAAVAVYQHGLHATQLLVPVIYVLQVLMVTGLVWLTASINVFFRDLQQAVPIIVLMLMMVSPIGYTPEMVPEGMRYITDYNPLAWLMELYRSCLIKGVVPWDKLALLAAFSALLLTLGYRVIHRLKPVFVDYV